jgi:hypothetical protein
LKYSKVNRELSFGGMVKFYVTIGFSVYFSNIVR